jgi:hypothetical protein
MRTIVVTGFVALAILTTAVVVGVHAALAGLDSITIQGSL